LPLGVEKGLKAMLTILGRETSLNARKLLWAADEMGLAYQREDWGLPLRDPSVPEFLALNPNGTVPVLRDGDFVLWESNAILVYLAELSGRLLPKDTKARALVHQWLSWQVSELNPAWGYAVMGKIRHRPDFQDEVLIAQSIARWTTQMQLLDTHLAQSATGFVAEDFSIADIALGLSVHRWMCFPDALPTLAAVDAYYQRLLARPAGAIRMGRDNP
jgi:glutathione S-transferase